MCWNSVLTTTDIDEYRTAIRPATEVLTVTGRGPFSASLTRVELGNLRMQRFQENLPRAWGLQVPATRTAIAFADGLRSAMCWRGADVAKNEMLILPASVFGWHVSSGEAHWGSMSLLNEHLAEASIALIGRDVTPSRDAVALLAPPFALRRLRQLHATVGHLAENTPDIVENPDAAHGLELVLTEAMLRCLNVKGVREDTAARRRHAAIIKRFHDFTEARANQALFLAEVCKAINVNERTLLNCCQEQLGTNPKRYLLMRRLHLARRDLRNANPATNSVTEVATRYGFWELGRFAAQYKLTYGETPSATLRSLPA